MIKGLTKSVIWDLIESEDEARAIAQPRPDYPNRIDCQGDERRYVREVVSVIDAHIETALRKVREGSTAHLIRVKLKKDVCHPSEISVKVHAPVRHLFSKLTSRIGPRSLYENAPVMVGCADDYWTIETIQLANALYDKGDRLSPGPSPKSLFNGLLLMPPNSRSRETVEEHVARHGFLYRRDGITDIEVNRVDPVDIPRACRRCFRGVLDGNIPICKGPLVLPDPIHH